MHNSAKSFRKFLLLWSGQLISSIGGGLTSFGLGIYVFQQTGMASATALVTLLAFTPSLLLSPYAGVLADRHDRRLLMIAGDGCSALGLVFILVCMLVGEAQLWHICAGVTISSVFSSLIEPAYKATVTDLLTEEEYTKASGLVQLAGAAKFLISPVVAGLLLAVSDIKLLLVIDICTIFVTVLTTMFVRRSLPANKTAHGETKSFLREIRTGWRTITRHRGVLVLVIVTSVLTFLVGFMETLSVPMLLAFADVAVIGTVVTVAASGMLVSSAILASIPIKKDHVKILSGALLCAGLFMGGFGFREHVLFVTLFGFLFFAALPFANAPLDFLIRTNIDPSVQGRAWSLIGLISQIGFVASYALAGVLADFVFTPLLVEGGALAGTVGKVIGTGSGRGIGFLIMIAGVLLCISALILSQLKSVKTLEPGGDPIHVPANHPS
jgi:MFS family permease